MANEIQWSGISSDTSRTVIISEMLSSLADEYALPNHPALITAPDAAGSGSDTVYIDSDDLESGGVLTSIAEGGTWANTAYASDRYSVSVGQYYKQWNISDLVALVNPGGKFDAARFARGLIKRHNLTMTDLLAAEGATFSTTVDAGSGDATMEDLFDAISSLEGAYVDPALPKIAIIHPTVGKQLRKDSLFAQSANNAMNDPGVKALAASLGGVYIGRFQNTDVFQSFQVATSGGKYQNCIFARGAMLTARGTARAQTADQVALEMVLFERYRSETKPEYLYRGSSFLGANIAQDGAGILWTTAA